MLALQYIVCVGVKKNLGCAEHDVYITSEVHTWLLAKLYLNSTVSGKHSIRLIQILINCFTAAALRKTYTKNLLKNAISHVRTVKMVYLPCREEQLGYLGNLLQL